MTTLKILLLALIPIGGGDTLGIAPLRCSTNPDASIRRTLGGSVHVDDVPGAEEATVIAFDGPEGLTVLADSGPFDTASSAGLLPLHWLATAGTRLLRTGAPTTFTDDLLHVNYRGSIRGRSVQMDMLIARRKGLPLIRLRILRSIAGGAPITPLVDPPGLLRAVERAWPDTRPAPEPPSAPTNAQLL